MSSADGTTPRHTPRHTTRHTSQAGYNTLRLDTWTADGRKIAMWRTTPAHGSGRGPVAVVSPGFGRTVADLTSVAVYLAANGVTSYRFDPLDHVGLSDGTIEHYTLSSTLRSIATVIETATRVESRRPSLIAASLSARPALRAARGTVDHVVTVVGVVDVRATLTTVFGPDLVDASPAELPPLVEYNGMQIEPAGVIADLERRNWDGLAGTVADLKRLACPVTAVYAERDPLIAADDVRRAYRTAGRRRDTLVSLDSAAHDLGEDPAAGLAALEIIAAAATGRSRQRVVIPSLDQLLTVAGEEQLWLARQQESSAGVTR